MELVQQHGEHVHELEDSLAARHSQEKNSMWESYTHEQAFTKQTHAEEVAALEERLRQAKKMREDEREYRAAKDKQYEEKILALKQGMCMCVHAYMCARAHAHAWLPPA